MSDHDWGANSGVIDVCSKCGVIRYQLDPKVEPKRTRFTYAINATTFVNSQPRCT